MIARAARRQAATLGALEAQRDYLRNKLRELEAQRECEGPATAAQLALLAATFNRK